MSLLARQPLPDTQDRFWQAAMLAFMLHAGGWALWHILPHVDTVVIPVKALNIRLGEDEGFIAQAVDTAETNSPLAAPSETRPGKMPGGPALSPMPGKSAEQSAEKPGEEKIAKRYLRKAAVPKGSVYGNSTETEAETLARYEQLISSWIQRYKLYPASARARGIQGEGVVRVRINRQGKILYYAIERSTGHAELDQAMLAMVRQASPVPPVPDRYPASTLVEFLIPVVYALESR